APKRHPVLPAERIQGLGRAQRGGRVATVEFELGFPRERMSHRWGVPEFFSPPVGLVDQFSRAIDLAQLPRRQSKTGHRQGPGVVAEAFAGLPVAPRVADLERALAMGTRLEEIAGKVIAQG